jgi:hypothetical protein
MEILIAFNGFIKEMLMNEKVCRAYFSFKKSDFEKMWKILFDSIFRNIYLFGRSLFDNLVD